MIVVANHIPDLARALGTRYDVVNVPHSDITNAFLRSCGCTALFVRTTTRVTPELLHGTPVQFVGTASAGYDHLDVDYLQKNAIQWTAAPGCNAHAVGEYVLSCVLKSGIHGSTSGILAEPTTAGTVPKVGIVGYGHTGRAAEKLLRKLGYDVVIHDPPALEAGLLSREESMHHRSLIELVSTCSVITNHVPLTSIGANATAHLFDAAIFEAMLPGTAFIHASRGGVVDESALLHAIRNKNIQACIDVWDNEPEYSVALSRASIISTPHIAGHSMDAHYVASAMMLRAYEAFRGGVPEDEIRVPIGPLRRSIREFTSLQLLSEALENVIDSDSLTRELQKVETTDPKECGKHFLRLRMSYTTRREILSME